MTKTDEYIKIKQREGEIEIKKNYLEIPCSHTSDTAAPNERIEAVHM